MALDGAFLYAVRQELLPLIEARVEKIHQPTREEVILSLRDREGSHKVLISASADRARVHLTEISVDNPKTPPMFCMLLRKRLGSGKLLAIRQDGLERVLYFDFSCVNELGDVVQLTLACEIMGRYSNLILIDEKGLIIDSIKRVDAETSRKRLVLPGVLYDMPPRERRLNFMTAGNQEIQEYISSQSGELSKVLLRTFEGVSPVLVREWTYYVGKGVECYSNSLTESQWERLFYILSHTKENLINMNLTYTVASTKEGQLKDFSFIPLRQYGTLLYTRELPSACTLLDYFYAERDRYARIRQRANDLFHLLLHTTERIHRRISSQTEELLQCNEKESLRRKADLISANLYKIKKGDKSVIVEDFYEDDYPSVNIELDVRLTPPQNAQKYYQAYKKACTAEKILSEQVEKGKQELQYLDSVLDALTRAETEDEISQLRLELSQQGYVRISKKKMPASKALSSMEFYSPNGMRILVGRNNLQNDQLTLKKASKMDIWFHTQNIPGSHVILETNGAEPDEETLHFTATIAAYHSKARSSSQVPVDYCQVKFVKKPVGAKPGMVIFTNNRTLYVTPPESLSEFLQEEIK